MMRMGKYSVLLQKGRHAHNNTNEPSSRTLINDNVVKRRRLGE